MRILYVSLLIAAFAAYFAMTQSNYYQANHFQAQAIPRLEPTSPVQDQEFSLNHRKSKTIFWFILALCLFLPFTKSLIINIFDLSQNIKKNIELRAKRAALIQDNAKLENQILEFRSFLGMKRTIKEEIKVIEENEILIKILP